MSRINALRNIFKDFLYRGAPTPHNHFSTHSALYGPKYLKSVEEKLGLPKRPKRPLTGYIRFSSENYASVRQNNPNLSVAELFTRIGQMWKSIGEVRQQEYAKESREKKSEYTAQLKEYNRKLSVDDKKRIEELKAKICARKEVLSIVKERRLSGKPKRPLGPYLRFCAERVLSRERGKAEQPFEYRKFILEVGKEWRALSDTEREKYETPPAELEAYYISLHKWEVEMIRAGRNNIIRGSPAVPRKLAKSKESCDNVSNETATKNK